MRRSRNERGEGRLGFLFAMVLLGSVVFLAFKLVPVRVQAYEFREILREEARFAAVRHDDKRVFERIIKKAANLEIPLTRKRLKIRRTTGEMIITASYERPVDLKLTTYQYKFNETARAPLF